MTVVEDIKKGFTIVELLIVIVIIAVLAAITIVAYNGIQNRAHDSTVHSDASAMAKKLEMMKVDMGRYPVSVAEFSTHPLKITKSAYSTTVNNMMYYLNRTTDEYGLIMVSKSGKGYLVTSGVIQEGVDATHGASAACNAVGASWANDSNNAALHGYNVTTGLWWSGWSLVN